MRIKAIVATALLFALGLTACEKAESAVGANAQFKGTEVPFTEFADNGEYYKLYANDNANQFALKKDEGEQIVLPSGYIPLQIVTAAKHQLVFAKEMFGQSVVLFEHKGDKFLSIELPSRFDEFLFRSAAWVENQMEASLYVVLYNTTSCTHQLYRMHLTKQEQFVLDDAFSCDLNFGANEIDENVQMIVTKPQPSYNGNRALLILGSEAYYCYQSWVPYTIARRTYGTEGVLSEIFDDGANQYFMYLQEERTVAVLCNANNAEDISSVRTYNGELAMIERRTEEKPQIVTVSSNADKIALLRKDLSHLPCSGVGELGSNNYEGRLPWSSVYYWNGLIDFMLPQFDEFLAIPGFEKFRFEIKARLDLEMKVLNQLLSSEIGLASKRYVVNRKLHLSVLHSQRILETVDRYRKYVESPVEVLGYDLLWERARTMKNTEEILVTATKGDRNGVAEGSQYFLTNEDLILDHVAAPYNYLSGWVSATCQKQQFYNDVVPGELTLAKDLISILLHDPQFLDKDEKAEWPYFFGEAYDGWDAPGEHKNVPYYVGDKHIADISYRSMDAKAIIYAMTVIPELRDDSVLNYLRQCVQNGSLYPFVNEAFIACGLPIAEIDPSALADNARVYHLWNTQVAAWSFYYTTKGER